MLSMNEVVARREASRRRRRVATWVGSVLVVLALVAVVGWQVVARTARIEQGAVSWWDGPAVEACGVRDDLPSAYVVGSQDPDRSVVYSVRNPNAVTVRLTSTYGPVRFQQDLFDPTADFEGEPSDDLVDSVVVPPGEEAFLQFEADGGEGSWSSGSQTALPVTLEALGIEQAASLPIDPVVVFVNGSSADADLVAAAVRDTCGE
ncbi:hypothetical protein IF650_08120 [Cellulosimicrobium terreum]|nr:hypothetical protein [Cellulosimicrobium terreum]